MSSDDLNFQFVTNNRLMTFAKRLPTVLPMALCAIILTLPTLEAVVALFVRNLDVSTMYKIM